MCYHIPNIQYAVILSSSSSSFSIFFVYCTVSRAVSRTSKSNFSITCIFVSFFNIALWSGQVNRLREATPRTVTVPHLGAVLQKKTEKNSPRSYRCNEKKTVHYSSVVNSFSPDECLYVCVLCMYVFCINNNKQHRSTWYVMVVGSGSCSNFTPYNHLTDSLLLGRFCAAPSCTLLECKTAFCFALIGLHQRKIFAITSHCIW